MVSDFRRKKIMRGFEFLDIDNSGTVEKSDFELATDRLARSRNLEPSDEQYKKLADFVLKVWESIQKEADTDNDGHVTSEEWLAMWDKNSRSSEAPAEWMNLLSRFTFSLLDPGKDDKIDKDEFVSVTTTFGRTYEEAVTAFEKISKGKPTVSYEEFQELYREYYATDDENAPGNFIFGRLKFQLQI